MRCVLSLFPPPIRPPRTGRRRLSFFHLRMPGVLTVPPCLFVQACCGAERISPPPGHVPRIFPAPVCVPPPCVRPALAAAYAQHAVTFLKKSLLFTTVSIKNPALFLLGSIPDKEGEEAYLPLLQPAGITALNFLLTRHFREGVKNAPFLPPSPKNHTCTH